jgi:predicted phage-related endonuclease
MASSNIRVADSVNRRSFIGGSDARIIMGQDEKASTHVHRRLKTRISG